MSIYKDKKPINKNRAKSTCKSITYCKLLNILQNFKRQERQ